SVSYYLRVYPDVAQNGIDPFVHYVRYAKNDKRIGRPDFSKGTTSGARSYDPALQTVLIVNHDASRTGAPLVGLELARHLSDDHTLFVCVMREGELVEEFLKAAVHVFVSETNRSDAEYYLRH